MNSDPSFQLYPSLTPTLELRGPFSLPAAAFFSELQRRGLTEVLIETRAIGEDGDVRGALEEIGEVALDVRNPPTQEIVVRSDGLVAALEIRGSQATLQVAGGSRDCVERWAGAIGECLPLPDGLATSTPMTFWSGCDDGCITSRHRRLDARPWHELVANYPAAVQRGLDALLDLDTPGGARMMVWHGPPGTGKTNALRALAHEWRAWCAVHVVIDPERFLGKDPDYLLKVVSASDFEQQAAREWKLIVLEDAGELISADARSQMGQAVSRALNITDGLLGQGERAVILVTTNEPVGRLHEAVVRDGRCLSQIHFGPLGIGEANGWLERRESEIRVTEPTTLARLFALAEGRRLDEASGNGTGPRIGFAAPA